MFGKIKYIYKLEACSGGPSVWSVAFHNARPKGQGRTTGGPQGVSCLNQSLSSGP